MCRYAPDKHPCQTSMTGAFDARVVSYGKSFTTPKRKERFKYHEKFGGQLLSLNNSVWVGCITGNALPC